MNNCCVWINWNPVPSITSEMECSQFSFEFLDEMVNKFWLRDLEQKLNSVANVKKVFPVDGNLAEASKRRDVLAESHEKSN